MEFAGRSSATSAAGVDDDGRRFPEPPSSPPHGDSTTMQVIRDALLSQLQKDRLRQEIIVAELSKIECAMALRSAAGNAKPATFDFDEQFVTHNRTGAVGPESQVGVGEAKDIKKETRRNKARRRSNERLGLVSKSASSSCEAPGSPKNLTRDDEGKPQESSEAKKSPSMKWVCTICHVEATSAGNLLDHFSGQKHRANVDDLKSKAKAETSKRNTAQCEEKSCPLWMCRFCQANCTGKSVFEQHMNGKKHHAKIQTLLKECNNMASVSASSWEADSHSSITSQDEQKLSICRICQVKWSCQSVMKGHVGGKKHMKNFQALQLEAKRLGIIQPKVTRKQQEPQEWNCGICQVRCNSESQFQDHCTGMEHMQMEKSLYFCKLCKLQCNGPKMLSHHQNGRKHQAKLRCC